MACPSDLLAQGFQSAATFTEDEIRADFSEIDVYKRQEHSGAEEPRVRITALPVENRITFEAVYSAQKKQKKRTPATKSSCLLYTSRCV